MSSQKQCDRIQLQEWQRRLGTTDRTEWYPGNHTAEVTPIENWLELESDVLPLNARISKEWDTALLFKEPWTMVRKVEFMQGVGLEWVHLKENGTTSNSIAG